MSRGPGNNQHRLLIALRQDCDWTTLETLRWELATEQDITEGKLSCSFDTALSRSLNGLTRKGLIEIEERKLRTLAEVVAHYPNKTLSTQIREMRHLIFPKIEELQSKGKGLGYRYHSKGNEEYIFERIPPQRQREIQEKWATIERDLRHCLSSSTSDELLLLVAKGRWFFVEERLRMPKPIETRDSLIDLITKIEEQNILSPHVLQELKAFYRDTFPADHIEQVELKSLIHSYATIHNGRGPAKLTPEAIKLLADEMGSELERIGAIPPQETQPTPPPWFQRDIPYAPKTTDLFHKLIDRHLLAPFRFIKIKQDS